MTTELHQKTLPTIVLTDIDFERLENLAQYAIGKFPAGEFLAREVDRAEVVSGAEPRSGLVRMGTEVEFRDDVTDQTRWVQLVFPDEADVTANKISVLTPIGAALIGLSVGQSIEWQLPSGGWKSLTVMAVRDPVT